MSKIPRLFEKGNEKPQAVFKGYGLTHKDLDQILRTLRNQSYGFL